MREFIPISQPSITEIEIKLVTDAVKSRWVSSLGEFISEFEAGFAEFCEVEHAIAVSNGTVAIQLALAAAGIGPGDEVIVPDLTFVATGNAVTHVGARAVVVDIDPENLCLNPTKIEEAVTARTRALLPVHLYGHPADMDAINNVAAKYGLIVIEDAAEAHGAKYKGRRVGGLGHCGTFSFYGNKLMTTGEGGMITTNDSCFDNRCRLLRDHAMSPTKRYWHEEPGYNFRITNLQAALGCAQLRRADQLLEKRQQIFQWYGARLSEVDGLSLNRASSWAENCYWLVNVEIHGANEQLRNQVMAELRRENVDSRPFFYPLSALPHFKSSSTSVSHSISKQGISLPTYFDLDEETVDRICGAFIRALERCRSWNTTVTSDGYSPAI